MTKNQIYILCFAASISFVIWFLYNDGYFNTGEPPLLTASSSPTKIKPDNPGGITADNYNPIYDQIKSQNHNFKTVTLIPEPEMPLVISSKTLEPEIDVIGNIVSNIIDVPQNIDNSHPPENNKNLKIITAPEDNAKIIAAKKNKSAYYIQIASTRTKAGANKEWARITREHSKLFTNISYRIEKYNISNKTYYRLLAGPLPSGGNAKLLCKKLANAKQNCVIKKI